MGSMGGGGGGSQTTQTVQKADPWEGQQPYLTPGFDRAKSIYMDAPQPKFYPESTVVPFSPETNAAISMQTSRAMNGSPLQDAASNQLTSTMRGDYLGNIMSQYNNPLQQSINSNALMPQINGDNLYGGAGFNAALDAASNKILPQIDSAFERSGRTGSGLAQTAKAQAIADAFASQYGQQQQNQLAAAQLGQQGNQNLMNALSTERENQMRGMMFAPQMASLDYQDIAKLAEVGAQKESLQQQQLGEKVARYDYNQNAAANQLAKYMNTIQGNYGGTTSGTSTTDGMGGSGRNPIMGAMGGLLSSSFLGMNPMMGLLSGLFGF